MKILKKGKLPPPKPEFRFECSNCGLVALAERSEVEWVEDRGQDYPTIKCPTPGCAQTLWGKRS